MRPSETLPWCPWPHVAALGFRQFLLRGLDNVRGQWNLITMARNVKLVAFASAA